MSQATYQTKAGDTVDAICHKHYGLNESAVLAVFSVNRGLASYGTTLPAGLTITLPELAPVNQKQSDYSIFD